MAGVIQRADDGEPLTHAQVNGRPASIDAQVRAMKASGMGATEIARELRIGRASVYRVLEA